MQKIVINRCFGGYGISKKAAERLLELGVVVTDEYKKFLTGDDEDFCYAVEHSIERTDLRLIQVIEELGAEADGRHALLDVVEVPDDVEWQIHNYDGRESVHEKHRSW